MLMMKDLYLETDTGSPRRCENRREKVLALRGLVENERDEATAKGNVKTTSTRVEQSLGNDSSEGTRLPDRQGDGSSSQMAIKIGDTGGHEHREDSKPRMIKIDDEADDTRECEWKNEDPMEMVETLEDEDREYYRPSYMFHWLRATGRGIQDAYQAFESYEGRNSFSRHMTFVGSSTHCRL